MPALRPAHSCRLPQAVFTWSLAALITSLARAQAKTVCVNLQLCAGLKAGIEGATHAVGHRRRNRVSGRRREEEVEDPAEEEEERGEVLAMRKILTIVTAGTEEEAAVSPAQQVRWERRRLSCKIGSFALDVRLRS